jgi:hypothetical protein
MAQALGHIGAHRQPQRGFVPRPQRRQNHPVMPRRFVARHPVIERAHRRPELQPDGLDHRQHRGRLRAQVKRAVEFQIGADIAHRVLFRDRLGIGGVDRAQPVDQRQMRARQGAGGEFRLDQRAQGGQLLDPVVRQLGRRHPARGRQHQRAFRHQPPQRLARGGHRHAVLLAQAPQRQRLTGQQLAMHDLLTQAAIQPVMGSGFDRTGADGGHAPL